MVNYHFRMGVKGLMKFSKPSLIKFIIKHELKKLPKKRLAVLYYELMKSRLPRLRTNFPATGKLPRLKLKRIGIGKEGRKFGIAAPTYEAVRPRRKKKRKFSRKQLAAQRLFAKRARAGTLRR